MSIETEDQVDVTVIPPEVIGLSCTSFSQGLSLCEAQFNQVLEGYRLYIQTLGGISGFSPFVSVEPGEADHIEIQVAPDPVVAGDDFDIYLSLFDSTTLSWTFSPTAMSIKEGQRL